MGGGKEALMDGGKEVAVGGGAAGKGIAVEAGCLSFPKFPFSFLGFDFLPFRFSKAGMFVVVSGSPDALAAFFSRTCRAALERTFAISSDRTLRGISRSDSGMTA